MQVKSLNTLSRLLHSDFHKKVAPPAGDIEAVDINCEGVDWDSFGCFQVVHPTIHLVESFLTSGRYVLHPLSVLLSMAAFFVQGSYW